MHRHSCTHATKNQLLTVESFVEEKKCHSSSPHWIISTSFTHLCCLIPDAGFFCHWSHGCLDTSNTVLFATVLRSILDSGGAHDLLQNCVGHLDCTHCFITLESAYRYLGGNLWGFSGKCCARDQKERGTLSMLQFYPPSLLYGLLSVFFLCQHLSLSSALLLFWWWTESFVSGKSC